jgi:hypothetical protein
MAGAQPDVGGALLAVAFQRIARDRGPEKQQVVEVGQAALGSAAANVVNAGGRSAPDFGVGVVGNVQDCFGGVWGKSLIVSPQYASALSMLKV